MFLAPLCFADQKKLAPRRSANLPGCGYSLLLALARMLRSKDHLARWQHRHRSPARNRRTTRQTRIAEHLAYLPTRRLSAVDTEAATPEGFLRRCWKQTAAVPTARGFSFIPSHPRSKEVTGRCPDLRVALPPRPPLGCLAPQTPVSCGTWGQVRPTSRKKR
jgi:hypothetical protein